MASVFTARLNVEASDVRAMLHEGAVRDGVLMTLELYKILKNRSAGCSSITWLYRPDLETS